MEKVINPYNIGTSCTCDVLRFNKKLCSGFLDKKQLAR